MRTDTQTESMQNYFMVHESGSPSSSRISQVGLALALFGIFIIFSFNNTVLVGTVLILTGLTLFGIWIKPYFQNKNLYKTRPSEEQMNNWLIKDLNHVIKETAIKKLRLNIDTFELKNFIIVPYPVYWEEPGLNEADLLQRTSENGNISYSVWNVQVIALTKNYISYYSCTYDWLNNLIVNEQTNEFFYDDISSVKNDQRIIDRYLKDSKQFDEGNRQTIPNKLTATVFEVTNISSDSLKVITNIDEMGHSPNLIVDLEKVVQVLRLILRKHRYNEEQEPIVVEKEEEKTSEGDNDKN